MLADTGSKILDKDLKFVRRTDETTFRTSYDRELYGLADKISEFSRRTVEICNFDFADVCRKSYIYSFNFSTSEPELTILSLSDKSALLDSLHRSTDKYFVAPSVFASSYTAAMADKVVNVLAATTSAAYLRTLVNELSSLQDGWCGVESARPSAAVISDLSTWSQNAPAYIVRPTAEVDPDGSVALLWERGGAAFALTFRGNGNVIGTLSPQSKSYRPWSLPVTALNEILRKLEADDVASVLR